MHFNGEKYFHVSKFSLSNFLQSLDFLLLARHLPCRATDLSYASSMTGPSTSNHTTSFCRNPSCTCPDYEPTSPLDNTSPCDTCSHRREWHLEGLYRLDPLNAREMKARGEETLEYCKALDAGRGCECPVFVQDSEKMECELCGHKKGWHRWKQVSFSVGCQSLEGVAVPTFFFGFAL